MRFIGTLIGLGWLLFLAFACWMIIQVNGTSCNFMEMLHMQSTGVVVSAMIIQSVISLVIYGLTLTITAYRIRKLKASLSPENQPETSFVVQTLQLNLRLCKLTKTLCLLYVICYAPNIITTTMTRYSVKSVPDGILIFASSLVPVNSLGNCVIYWFRSQEFRKIWRHMLSCISVNAVAPNPSF